MPHLRKVSYNSCYADFLVGSVSDADVMVKTAYRRRSRLLQSAGRVSWCSTEVTRLRSISG